MPAALSIIESARGVPLIWSQTRALSREYLLSAGDRTLGTLTWPKTFGSLAEGRIGAETWTFKRVGFWQPSVTIRRPETGEQDVALFEMNWRRGDLVLPGDIRYHWDKISFWKSEWAFFDPTGKERIVEFIPQRRFLRMSTEARIGARGKRASDLPLLLLLGWYLLVMASRDDGASITMMG